MSEKTNKNKKQNKGEKQPHKKDDKPNKGDPKGQKPYKKPDKVPQSQVKDVKPLPKTVQIPVENISSEPVITENIRGKYSRRKIETNVTKPDLPENIYEITNEESRQSAVENIFKKPISLGGHFQFKHEKSWNFVEKKLEDNDLFALNLKTIMEHVSCIPFYERNEIDASIFSEKEIESMDQMANVSKLKYGIYDNENVDFLQNLNLNDTSIEKDKSPEKVIELNKTPDRRKSNDSDELERILSLSSLKDASLNVVKPGNKPSTEVIIDPNDNLEDWLDEFL